MTQEEITKALKSSKTLQIYDMPNLTSFEDYTPEELENMTYIYITPLLNKQKLLNNIHTPLIYIPHTYSITYPILHSNRHLQIKLLQYIIL